MTALPRLSTPRLQLREMQDTDTASYAELLMEELAYFVADAPIVADEVPARIQRNRQACDEGRALYWSIEHQRQFAGFIALHQPTSGTPILGYAIAQRWRRQGFASEALRAVTQYAFAELGSSRVIAYTHLENIPSAALLQSLGFEYEGIVERPLGQRRMYSLPSKA
jgi:RimJ/RimL family protein N-acetyltransferase